jgi:hypothetical protein
MRKLMIYTTGLFFLMAIQGCDKEGVCVKSTGKIVTENRIALPYNYIEVYDNINLFLVQDTALSEIKVEAGENLIAGIITDIDSGRLVLRNANSCNWLRSFEVPVNVYLKFTRLDTIIFQAAGNITCLNAWTNDSVYIYVIEGAGQLNFNLDVGRSFIHVRYGTVSMKVAGKSPVTFIISQGYGPVHAEELISKFTYVSTSSPNDVYVFASEELDVEIGNIGNVYYSGAPKDITANIYGDGKLIEF